MLGAIVYASRLRVIDRTCILVLKFMLLENRRLSLVLNGCLSSATILAFVGTSRRSGALEVWQVLNRARYNLHYRCIVIALQQAFLLTRVVMQADALIWRFIRDHMVCIFPGFKRYRWSKFLVHPVTLPHHLLLDWFRCICVGGFTD